MKRTANARWQGTGREGQGTVSTQSKVLNNKAYSFSSRFEEGEGTNPEELVAAAHAGCFSMKLSFNLTGAGFPPTTIDTQCEITLDPAKGEITSSQLTVKAKVPGITEEKFLELVKNASETCPISKLLNTNITHTASLEN